MSKSKDYLECDDKHNYHKCADFPVAFPASLDRAATVAHDNFPLDRQECAVDNPTRTGHA